jgi:hypothetical protein
MLPKRWRLRSWSNSIYDKYKNSANKIGGILRAGFEAHHFRFSLEYNFVPTTHTSYIDSEGGSPKTMGMDYKNNYFGMSFGIHW